MWLLLLLGCPSPPVGHTGDPRESAETGDSADTADTGESAESTPATRVVRVRVLLDGAPAPDTLVVQGGNPARWTTDAAGEVTVTVDYSVVGDIFVLGVHPEARVAGTEVLPDTPEPVEIALTRYDPTDNPEYEFQEPGEGDPADSNSSECLHCHITLHEGWFGSPHRTSASNPVLHDVYQGLAQLDEQACLDAGGALAAVEEPGTGATVTRCRVDEGVRDGTGGVGACADCHAPGIDGQLGGRDLLEARGTAFDDGVHCDVCHRVESVDPTAAPGVAGWLHLHRPSEPSPTKTLGAWLPLTFGPLPDVLNPRMGAVWREELYHGADLCGGCHELAQEVLVEGQAVDRSRWPDGRLPIHTTWSEWVAGPMNPSAPCQSCHMPPLAFAGNSADLYNLMEDPASVGISTGWERPPGEVRAHTFSGPRDASANMLELAASVDVAGEVADGVVEVRATVRNVGPGHAIPTGEPMRALLLRVEARCDGVAQPAVGGDVVPDFGGYLERREAGADWSDWPEARVGDRLRVVARPGGWVDYAGYGPFGDGTFDPEARGMPIEDFVAEVEVLGVDPLVLSGPLPAGDVVYRVADGAWAGAPGFGFARVLVDADGARMVPHWKAVDVVSDNRLLPQAAWTSTHRFATSCAAPELRAELVHRDYPWALADARGWAVTDRPMDEVTR